MNKKFIAIVPVRDDSSRLKNKASGIKIYKDYSSMDCIKNRLLNSRFIDEIFFIYPNTKENAHIKNIIRKYKEEHHTNIIKSFAGDLNDLSKRAMDAIKEGYFNRRGVSNIRSYLEDVVIVNVTIDCPLVDPKQIDELILHYYEKKKEGQYLYLSNVVTRSWPDGFDVQVYDYELLKRARKYSLGNHNITNLGWDIMNYSGFLDVDFKILNYSAHRQYWHPTWGLTMDYEEDIEVIRKIYKYFDNFDFTQVQVIEYLENHPEILEINKKCKRTVSGE